MNSKKISIKTKLFGNKKTFSSSIYVELTVNFGRAHKKRENFSRLWIILNIKSSVYKFIETNPHQKPANPAHYTQHASDKFKERNDVFHLEMLHISIRPLCEILFCIWKNNHWRQWKSVKKYVHKLFRNGRKERVKQKLIPFSLNCIISRFRVFTVARKFAK